MAARILAIDPGPTRSALVELVDGQLADRLLVANAEALAYVSTSPADVLVVEWIESFGMAVGAEVFHTCRWIGRFEQAFEPGGLRRFETVTRREVKLHLCNSVRAKDSNIRAALLDHFGGPAAIGRKHDPGPLYGFKADLWSALAVLVTWLERDPNRVHSDPF